MDFHRSRGGRRGQGKICARRPTGGVSKNDLWMAAERNVCGNHGRNRRGVGGVEDAGAVVVQRGGETNKRGGPMEVRSRRRDAVMIYSGISPTPRSASTRDNRSMAKRGKNSLRQEVATELHDGLGQHLLGSMLSARVLVKLLEERNAPELDQARSLLSHLRSATDNIQDIIRKLDVGHSS